MTRNNFIVVHAGNRDYYNLALALYESQKLECLVTDDYFLRAESHQVGIPKNKIRISYIALMLSLLNRFSGKFIDINRYKDFFLSEKAYVLAKRSKSHVFSYSYYASYVFSGIKDINQKKILFQLHPNPISIRNIFKKEISHLPLSEKSLSQEHELKISELDIMKLHNEANLADKVICASSFTKMTLVENGIDEKKIVVVPYGVSVDKFTYIERVSNPNTQFSVLFVGSINQRKGVFYLSEAIKVLQERGYNIDLTVVGRGITDLGLISPEIKNLKVCIDIPFDELLNLYHKSDVFLFPSLCEGFGHVILEAMATGLPVITTENTAGKDLIIDGKDGFIIEIRDVNSIVEKIIYLIDNPVSRVEIGKAAANKARSYTWERFRSKINEEIKNI